jgi:hypothetical protein
MAAWIFAPCTTGPFPRMISCSSCFRDIFAKIIDFGGIRHRGTDWQFSFFRDRQEQHTYHLRNPMNATLTHLSRISIGLLTFDP